LKILKNKIIFIALDCEIHQIKKVLKVIPKSKIKFGLKLGYKTFFAKGGREFIKKISRKYPIFLDLKIHDIDSTMVNGVKSLKDMSNIKYLTIHSASGKNAIRQVKKAAGKIKLLSVTTLTSFDQKNIEEIGYKRKLKDLVLLQAKLSKAAGCWGVICSAHESQSIKQKVRGLKTVCPGIRMPGDKLNNQKRVTTPKEALFGKANADGIVMGRSLIQGSIKNNFKRLIKHLEE
jgi:orotidine-5'-phosphate decarboxylase